MLKLVNEVTTGRDITKCEYQEILEPFEIELDKLSVDYGRKKYVLLLKQEKIMTNMKVRFNTSPADDEYIKTIQRELNDLQGYLKTKHVL